MRYAYGVAMALLLGGTAFSVATGQAGAQVAQNAPSAIVPRPGAPTSFADLAAKLALAGRVELGGRNRESSHGGLKFFTRKSDFLYLREINLHGELGFSLGWPPPGTAPRRRTIKLRRHALIRS